MKKSIIVSLFLLICVVAPLPIDGAEEQHFSPYRISPVYEQMVGNQVFRLWNELIQKKAIQPNDSFFIAGWGKEENSLAHQVVLSFKHDHQKEAHGQFRFLKNWKDHGKDTSSYGVILVGAAQPEGFRQLSLKDFQDIASLYNASRSKGFLVVFASGSQTHLGLLQSIFEGAGLKMHSMMSLFELEYVEGELNRQATNLDFPDTKNRIFERFVRQGMNPVRAHPSTEEAIQNFRKANEPKILIVGKN